MPNLARYQRGFGRRKPGPSYRLDYSNPLTRNLRSCWLFNEGGGLLSRDLILSRTGTNIGGVIWKAGDFFCGPTLYLNGSSGYVSFGTGPSILGTSNFTVSFWMKTSAVTSSHIYGQREAGATGYEGEIIVGVNATGTVFLVVYNDLSGGPGHQWGAAITTPLAYNDNKWHHIVATRSNGPGYIYVDGLLAASASAASNVSLLSLNCYYGANVRDSTEFFAGFLDNLLIYQRDLSAQEIWQLYQEPFAFIKQAAPKRTIFGPTQAPATPASFNAAWVYQNTNVIVGGGTY